MKTNSAIDFNRFQNRINGCYLIKRIFLNKKNSSQIFFPISINIIFFGMVLWQKLFQYHKNDCFEAIQKYSKYQTESPRLEQRPVFEF